MGSITKSRNNIALGARDSSMKFFTFPLKEDIVIKTILTLTTTHNVWFTEGKKIIAYLATFFLYEAMNSIRIFFFLLSSVQRNGYSSKMF